MSGVVVGFAVALMLAHASFAQEQSERSKAPATTPQLIEWGPKYATPGTELRLEEIERKTISGRKAVVYRLVPSGFPKGTAVDVWHWKIDASPQRMVTGHVVGKSGEVVLQNDPTDELQLVATHFAKGELFLIGLFTADGSVRAFGKVTPFPIEARDGRCRLWVELLSPRGDVFAYGGEGFEADEDLTVVQWSNGERITKTARASSDGTLPYSVVFPAVSGKTTGTVSATVTGRACKVKVEYAWGPRALEVQ